MKVQFEFTKTELVAILIATHGLVPSLSLGTSPPQNVRLAHAGVATSVTTVGPRLVAVTGNSILVSDDAGQNWSLSPVDTSLSAVAVSACSDSEVVASLRDKDYNASLFTSNDGGSNWDSLWAGTASTVFRPISCLSNRDILIGGDRSGLLRFNRADSSLSVAFIPPQAASRWVLGTPESDVIWAGYSACLENSCGGLVRSTDGGSSFSFDSLWSESWSVESVTAFGADSVYVNGWQNARLYSPDIGEWLSQPDPFVSNRVVVGPRGLLLAAGDNNVFQSPDFGSSWKSMAIPAELMPIIAYDLALAPDSSLVVATSRGILRISEYYPTAVDANTSGRRRPVLDIFPNPFVESITIQSETGELVRIALFDMVGRARIYRQVQPGSEIQIDASSFASGVYVIRSCTRTTCSTQVLVKAYR